MFRLGCAVWAHKGWAGRLYPEDAPARDLLRLYGGKLTCVEGNTTFYASPSPEVVEKWSEAVPDDFRFCPKLPRAVTHEGAIAPQSASAWEFAELMGLLGDRLGPMFAQLPPSYSPRRLADLTTFLDAWPHGRFPLALEVRNPEWFDAPYSRRLHRLLASLNVGKVLLDTRPLYDGPDDGRIEAERKKPELPLMPVVTANFAFVRYIGHPDLDRNEIYLEEWAARVESWLEQEIDVYFFCHCPDEDYSVDIARRLHGLLLERGLRIPAIDWSLPGSEGVSEKQLALF